MIAFLGDSLTDGWLTEGRETWDERFAPLGAQNFGVPGDLTDDVLQRIEAGELDAARPDTIVLLAGTNDLGSGRSPERTVRGIERCVRALLERFEHAQVVVLSLLPRGDAGVLGYTEIAAANERLELLEFGPRVRLFDCSAAFVGTSGTVRQERYDPDLLHLCRAGYAAWGRVLDALINETELGNRR